MDIYFLIQIRWLVEEIKVLKTGREKRDKLDYCQMLCRPDQKMAAWMADGRWVRWAHRAGCFSIFFLKGFFSKKKMEFLNWRANVNHHFSHNSRN